MSYNIQEISLAGGQPVEFYDFTLGSNSYNYTSAEDEIVVGAITYTPVAISRSSVSLGAESAQEILNVMMPSNAAPADEYISIVPGQVCTLSIKRYHRSDSGLEMILIFKGILRTVAYTDDGHSAALSLVPLTNGFSREVPRYTYQSLCNNILYDTRCSVLQSSYQHTGQVTNINETVLTITGADGQPDGYYTAGFVQFGTTDFRLIIKHVGTEITILLPFNKTPLGSDVDVFAGCDHTMETCVSKFNNGINYFGCPFVPTRNIFQNGIK
ncbi:MAG: phage BR0599 family protein [Candidatus Sabulitectum sp.]|nr:phage BR0599 family protein [Candidatus Sabulitectum sp.]